MNDDLSAKIKIKNAIVMLDDVTRQTYGTIYDSMESLFDADDLVDKQEALECEFNRISDAVSFIMLLLEEIYE